MFIKQLSVFMENKPGRMAEISRILANGGVNIRAVSVADTTGYGILRLIVSDPEKAKEVCDKNGLTAALTDAIAISAQDKPGGFADIVEIIANADISLEYMYAFSTPSLGNCACVIICTSDGEKAVATLKEHGVKMLSGEEIYLM